MSTPAGRPAACWPVRATREVVVPSDFHTPLVPAVEVEDRKMVIPPAAWTGKPRPLNVTPAGAPGAWNPCRAISLSGPPVLGSDQIPVLLMLLTPPGPTCIVVRNAYPPSGAT